MSYRPTVVRWAIALAAIWLVALPRIVLSDNDSYMTRMDSGLHLLQQGEYVDAAAAFDSALDLDLNSPPARDGMGVTLLLSGQTLEAKHHFAQALKSDPKDPVALAGSAMCEIISGQLVQGKEKLSSIHGEMSPVWTGSVAAYIDAITGSSAMPSGDDPLDSAIRAGLPGPAPDQKELEILAKRIFATRFDDLPGLYATFDPLVPIVTGRLVKAQARARKGVDTGKTYGESITLTAKLGNRSDVRYVQFQVDGNVVGITNSEPFRYIWDTTRVLNGDHTVVISGCTSSGEVVSTQTRTIRVFNEFSNAPATWRTDGAKDVARGLVALMAVQPSSKVVHYWLGRYRAIDGDKEGATAAFEYTVSIDPDYRDVRHRLIEAYGPSHAGGPLWVGPTGRKVVAISFDDGPRGDTDLLLDQLKTEGIKATFFLVGMRAQKYPDVVKRIVEDGHALGNHSFSHPRMTDLSPTEVERQIIRTNAVVREATGLRLTIFRPPGGHFGPMVFDVLRRYGIQPVFWTVNCGFLEGGSSTAMAQYALAHTRDGAVVLMHNGENTTIHALPPFIRGLQQLGYECVTIPELTAVRKPEAVSRTQ